MITRHKLPDGTEWQVTWAAASAHDVTVYRIADHRQIERSRPSVLQAIGYIAGAVFIGASALAWALLAFIVWGTP